MAQSETKHKDLVNRRCVSCEGGIAALDEQSVTQWLQVVPGWAKLENPSSIERVFEFPDYAHALSFVGAVAWVAIRENHHPVIELHYGRCIVRYYTHAIGGLSENDFICAAKVNALYDD